jgi:O-antigen ligase
MEYMIFGSLLVLAFGLFMSITVLALSHILIAVPALYFSFKQDWKRLSVSNWALLIFSILIPISIYTTRNNAISLGLYNIMKFKYYMLGALMGAPFAWFFKKRATDKQIRILLWTALISSSLASLAGMIALYTGYNPLKMAPPTSVTQNGGMFGMLMSYAHSEAIWCVLIFGLIINYKKIEKYLPVWLLATTAIINFAGFITSYTRGAHMAFLIAIPFFFFKANKKKFIGAITAMILFCAIAWTAVPQIRVIFSGRQHSNLLRIGQWQAALKVFELHPIAGVGFRNFQPYSTVIKKEYGYPEPLWSGHAHNNALEVAAGMGVIGLIPFLVWIFAWLVESYKRDDLMARLAFPCVIAIIIGGLTQNTITDGINAFLFMALYGLSQIEAHTP